MNRLEPGADVGVSATLPTTSGMGIGVDVAYHYWPLSGAFKQRFNDRLHRTTLNTLELGAGTWGLQVVQYGGHIRVDESEFHGVRTWVTIGMHAFLVDPRITGYEGDAGFFQVWASPLPVTNNLGGSIMAGADLFGHRHARMGLHAAYYIVECSERYGSDLQVFTAGAHLLFGW